MARLRTVLVLALALLFGLPAHARAMRTVEVSGSRLMLGHILPDIGDELATIELGSTPSPGGSRVVRQAEITDELERQHVFGVAGIPKTVRVVRKMAHLNREDVRKITTEAISPDVLPKGVTIRRIKPPRQARVAAGYDEVTASIPKPPRRQGNWSTTALLHFSEQGRVIARVAVPVDLSISEAGAQPDVSKGSAITLIVRHGLIEIRAKGVAAASADIGDTLNVEIRPSGKIVRAKLLDSRRALAVGNP